MDAPLSEKKEEEENDGEGGAGGGEENNLFRRGFRDPYAFEDPANKSMKY